MADVQTAAQIVNSIGFPIFMCLVFIYFTYKMLVKFQETITELKGSIDKLYSMITHMEATGELIAAKGGSNVKHSDETNHNHD